MGTENKQDVNWRKMTGEADARPTQRRPIRTKMADFIEHLLCARPQAIYLMCPRAIVHTRSVELICQAY